jgi:hypothetical protein
MCHRRPWRDVNLLIVTQFCISDSAIAEDVIYIADKVDFRADFVEAMMQTTDSVF